ncbi:MAG: prolyl oligopeptidase family serine peptidase [Erythrobacter sp.]
MQFRSLIAASTLALCAAGLAAPVAAQEEATELQLPALSEYGKLPEIEEVAISPSGQRIALLLQVKGKRLLVGYEGKDIVLKPISVGDMKVRYIQWIGEDRVNLVASQTEDLGYGWTTDKAEFYVGRIIPVNPQAEAGVIFAKHKTLLDTIVGNYGVRQIAGKWYGFYGGIQLKRSGNDRLKYEWNHGRPFLFKVDMQTLQAKKIANAAQDGWDNDWLIDANGEVAATFAINDSSGKWRLRGNSNKVIAQGQNETGRVGIVGLGQGGLSVIMSERSATSNDWYEISLADGSRKPFLDEVNWDRLYFDDMTGHLIGYLADQGEPKPVFFDKELESSAGRIRRAFGKLETRMIDWTSDLKKAVVRTSGNQDSGTIFAIDIEQGRADAIAYERDLIGPQHVGPISTFEYTASDGTQMDGILTLPPGKEAKKLPVVVLPHGGPHSADHPDFDWWAQAYASKGYAVFQPNFRGSTNRNGAFVRAGYGEWGRKMQTDKSDGLAALAEAGIVDSNRACIVGASYGGYAALAGVTIQKDIYRCAVAVAPVSDIRNMFREDYRATNNDRTTQKALLEQLGPRDRWDAVSPLKLAEKASAPIMLIHGKDDVVVPYSHSSKMADKLKDYKKPYEIVTLDGEDHWLSLSNTRQLMLEKAVGFVEKHNPAD